MTANSTLSASSCRCAISWRPNTTWWSQWVPFIQSLLKRRSLLCVWRALILIIFVFAVWERRQEVLHHGRRRHALYWPPAVGRVSSNQQGHPASVPQTPLRLRSTINPQLLHLTSAQLHHHHPNSPLRLSKKISHCSVMNLSGCGTRTRGKTGEKHTLCSSSLWF